MQILRTGQSHWVCTALLDGDVQLFDSLAASRLTSTLEEQVDRLYGRVQEDPTITLSRRPVQQQTGGADCGIFAIAYAYHAARGDKVETLNFDQARMRQHLLNCFEKELLSPFPVLDQKAKEM